MGGLRVAILAEHKGIYGFLYGAGDPKIGKIINGTAKDGRAIRGKFLRGLPSLDRLMTRVKKASQRGYLIGLDGRRVMMRKDDSGKIKEHTALNTLLQSAGSIIFKTTLALVKKRILDKRDSVKLLISYHDELQVECNPDEAQEVSDAIIKCMQDVGNYYELRCPITGEGNIGYTWSETH